MKLKSSHISSRSRDGVDGDRRPALSGRDFLGNMLSCVRLPGAIIVGAPRSGTTTLFGALRAHPGVFAAHGKELHFFDHHWDEGVDWYSAHFDNAQPGQVAIEATPMYLSNPIAMARISSLCPRAQLIAILRHPVERMHSHFYYRRARGLDSGAIEDAIKREVAGETGAFPYLGIGCYHRQLVHANSLGHENPIHVLWYDDLVGDPVGIAARLAGAVGVPPASLDLGGRRVNSADEFRSVRLRRAAKRWPHLVRSVVARVNRREVTYPPLADVTRSEALEFVADDIRQLGELTGRNLAHWLE